jgi:hypothetical protein
MPDVTIGGEFIEFLPEKLVLCRVWYNASRKRIALRRWLVVGSAAVVFASPLDRPEYLLRPRRSICTTFQGSVCRFS